tara:strand:- start:75689 stop:76432 length:744 start_codon:yes stop_codon:yes gene_type:complete
MSDMNHPRVVMVTGASGDIGTAVCQRLLANGVAIAAVDLQSVPLAGVQAFSCDVTDRAALQATIEAVETGMGPINGLVNVAGILACGAALDADPSVIERVWRVNFLGTFNACQLVGRGMVARQQGAIVNIGSVVGKNAGNARPWLNPDESVAAAGVAYGTAKAAVHALTGFLAREFAAAGVRVNTVAPGPVVSPMTRQFPEMLRKLIPLGRMAQPDEVAAAIEFLLSEQASFITGETLDVNGALWCD